MILVVVYEFSSSSSLRSSHLIDWKILHYSIFVASTNNIIGKRSQMTWEYT